MSTQEQITKGHRVDTFTENRHDTDTLVSQKNVDDCGCIENDRNIKSSWDLR